MTNPRRRIGIGLAGVVFLVVVVPPLRRTVSLATSRVIRWAASPVTPPIPDFHRLPDTTRIPAADGSDRAVLAAEDADSSTTAASTRLAIVRAVVSTALGHSGGGSTITRQLATMNALPNRSGATPGPDHHGDDRAGHDLNDSNDVSDERGRRDRPKPLGQTYCSTVMTTLPSYALAGCSVPPGGTSEEPPPPLPGSETVQRWSAST